LSLRLPSPLLKTAKKKQMATGKPIRPTMKATKIRSRSKKSTTKAKTAKPKTPKTKRSAGKSKRKKPPKSVDPNDGETVKAIAAKAGEIELPIVGTTTRGTHLAT
jgi:hypothetical protein